MQKQRRFKQESSLQDRILEWADALQNEANEAPPGHDREELFKKLHQAENAMHLSEFIAPRGVEPSR